MVRRNPLKFLGWLDETRKLPKMARASFANNLPFPAFSGKKRLAARSVQPRHRGQVPCPRLAGAPPAALYAVAPGQRAMRGWVGGSLAGLVGALRDDSEAWLRLAAMPFIVCVLWVGRGMLRDFLNFVLELVQVILAGTTGGK